MAIDPNVFDKLKTFEDYNKADQAFQLQKALQAQQMQAANTQNQLQQFQLNKLQTGQLSPEEMLTAKLKLAEINAQNPSIMAGKAPMTLEDIMGNGSSPQLGQIPTQQQTPQSPNGLNPMMPALVQQESGGNPNALSPKGAAGAFQIMPTTAAQPGYGVAPLRWWDGKDPRTAPQMEQQRFANDYANAMQGKFGNSPQLAAAAYNAGPGAVGKAMQATGGDPQAAISQLPAETQDYVPKVAGQTSQQVYHSPISDDGKKLLSSLQPQYQARIQGMIDGNIPLPPPGSLARSGPEGKLANQLYDTALQIDPTLTADRFPTMQKFNHGPEGRQVASFNKVAEHLDLLRNLATALSNGDNQTINRLSNAFQTEFGQTPPNNFEAAKQLVSDEITKGIIGSSGALADREGTAKSLASYSSPQQITELLDKVITPAIHGQFVGLQKQYENTGRSDFLSRLTPAAQAMFNPQTPSIPQSKATTLAASGQADFAASKIATPEEIAAYKAARGIK